MKTSFEAVSINVVMGVGLITVFAMALLTDCTEQKMDDVQRKG